MTGAPSTRPLRDMLVIALPSVVTMSSYTVMQFMDGMMVSRISPPSPIYVAAQGNGGMAMFMPLSFLMGVFGIINTYVSQNLGADRPEQGSPYAWTGLWMSVVGGLSMLGFGLLLPTIFGMLDHDPELERLEVAYAQILCAGAVLTLSTRSIAHYFYGLHRPMTVMVAAL
ncbi:MAG: hypothetical protein KDA28_04115, partial [Phycisphaerales bacterium]|nr:hypothetical protein [Phycisphaerales bacterium]